MYIKIIALIFILIQISCTVNSNQTVYLKRPNIILILADDLGWSDLGCYGGEVETPNLDRLAENGIRFTQIYNTSKCFPSRASLLTGLYAQQVGYDKTFRKPIKNGITLGEVLRKTGYRTLWSGKHHGIESPIERGFDRYFGLRYGASNHFNPGKQRKGENPPAQKRSNRVWYIDSVKYQPYTPSNKNFYTTDEFTDYALEWLEEYKDESKPFFLYLAYTAPHDPLMAWQDDINKYRGKYLAGYESVRNRRFEKLKMIGLIDNSYRLSEPSHEDWNSMTQAQKDEEDLKMSVFAAMIDRMDQNIGRVIRKLIDLGEFENTLILFLSDNGSSAEVVNIPGIVVIGSLGRWTSLGENWANVSNTPFRYYKNYSYEGGIRTPMIVHWPNRIKEPKIISEFAGHFIDIMPTILDIIGEEYSLKYNNKKILPLMGQSLYPLLVEGKEIVRNKPLFFEWRDGKAVRKGKWKIVSEKSEVWELYNILNDPTETVNLADKHPRIVQELDQLFTNWKSNNENLNLK